LLCNFGEMKAVRIAILFIFVLIIGIEAVDAQCAMCKAVLESNMQSGEEAVGKGINDGIVYIMFVPYILLTVVGVVMYRHYKKTKAIEVQ